MNRRNYFIVFIFLFYIISVSAQKRTIYLVGTTGTKESRQGAWLELIYTEVFNRMNMNLSYEGYPAARASIMSDSGEVDGEIHRVVSYGNSHPNMIRVEENHFSLNFSAFSFDDSIRLDGWESLKETDYKVEYRRGVALTAIELSKVVRPENLSEITNILFALKKVQGGKVDIYIDVESVVEDILVENSYLTESGLKNVGIMESITVHCFLNKKNADLVPKIDEILRQMKEEGLIDKYKEKTFK